MKPGRNVRIAALGLATLAANADAQVGLMPVPVFKDAATRAEASS